MKEIRKNTNGVCVTGPRDQIEEWLNDNYREMAATTHHTHKAQLDAIEGNAYKTGESPNEIGFGWVFTINESHPPALDGSGEPVKAAMTVDKIWVALIGKEAWEAEVPII
jgi:hypothetical protein